MYLDFVKRLAVKDLYFYANVMDKMDIGTEVLYNQTVIALVMKRSGQIEPTKCFVNDFNFIDAKNRNVQETPVWNAFLLERFGGDYAEVLKNESPSLYEKAHNLQQFVKDSLKTYDEKMAPVEDNLAKTMGKEKSETYLNNSVEAMISSTLSFQHALC